MGRSRSPLADRLFGLLLRLFPSDFRADFSAEMTDDFRDQRREAYRSRGLRGVLLLWARTVRDVLRQAPREQAETLGADVRYAFRMMRRHAATTAILTLLLAVGIGANVAVFGFADPMLRRPLPVPAAESLVRVLQGDEGSGIVSHATYKDLRDRNRVFDGVAAHQYTFVSFGTGEAAETLAGEVVSGTYFDVLRIRPALGRLLQPADDAAVGAHPVVVLSHGFWRDRLGSQPDIVGTTLRLNGHAFEVVGVTPEGFTGSYTALASAFWAPIAMYKQVRPQNIDLDKRGWGWLTITARLRAGVPASSADADLARIGADLKREYPGQDDSYRFRTVAASGLPEGLRGTARTVLMFASVIGVLILVVTCANVAGVLQSRALARVRETSIRYALGASRFRVVRQWLTESVCLALIGGIGALVAERWMHAGLVHLMQSDQPLEVARLPALDLRVLGFTVAVAVGAGLVFGLFPAWRAASRGEAALRESGATTTGSRRRVRSLRWLVAIQVSVCLCLLVVAGLLTRSLHNVRTFDPGFDPSGLVVARLNLARLGYDARRGAAFYDTLAARLRARPDVSGVSRAGVVPLGGDRERQGFRIPGHASPSGRPIILIDVNPVGRDYFEVAGIRLLKGRGFTAQDGPGTRGVVVVNETMASRYWPKGDAVGRTISLAGQGSPDLEIVGIAKDIKYYSLDETPRPYVYLSAGQAGGAGGILHVRANGDPRPVIAALKREGAAIDPAVVIDRPMTFEELRQLPLAGRRAMTVMANVFGAIALVLTIVGLYGTMSNTVAQRTREIGVRMAFGADAVRVSRLVVGAGLVPVAAGILFGFVLAGIVGRLVANELFGITPGDPATHAAAAAAVLLASIAALAGPARRATRVDPVAILRE